MPGMPARKPSTKMAEEAGERNWVALHFNKDRSYRNDNVDLPTLQPWVLKTEPPSDRFIFERNPYFHRVDAAGCSFPISTRWRSRSPSGDLIPAKVAAGEADLQGAYLGFSNYTFLKEAEERSGYKVRRWLATKGARVALYPDLNVEGSGPARALPQRRLPPRAVGRASTATTSTTPSSTGSPRRRTTPCCRNRRSSRTSTRRSGREYDPDLANELLDELGLTKRNANGIRLLPDGRPMQIVVETAGEEARADRRAGAGVATTGRRSASRVFIKPSQREVFYNRINAGDHADGGLARAGERHARMPTMSPAEFAPLTPDQFQWPAWGLWAQTSGQMGEEPDLEAGQAADGAEGRVGRRPAIPTQQAAIWHEILTIWTDQVFTIGIVSGVDQLVVVSDKLQNVPERGIYNFDPGAYLRHVPPRHVLVRRLRTERSRFRSRPVAVTAPLRHYVSDEAFDPEATVAPGSAPSERYLKASQGQIIWWRFKRHRIAYLSLWLLGAQLLLDLLLASSSRPTTCTSATSSFIYAPPQRRASLPRGTASSGRSSIRSASR